MVNIAVQEKYIQALQVLGDLQQTVEKAIQRYAVEQISEKIIELRERSKAYQKQYGRDYASFEKRIAEDAEFVEYIEQHVTPTWELDLADWEFCEKGIDDWTHKIPVLCA